MVRKAGEVEEPWRRWYKTQRWKGMRLRQLTAHPLCRLCADEGRVTVATVANHKIPHRGDPALFWDEKNLESVCAPHHDVTIQSIERGKPHQAIGPDGWPAETPADRRGA